MENKAGMLSVFIVLFFASFAFAQVAVAGDAGAYGAVGGGYAHQATQAAQAQQYRMPSDNFVSNYNSMPVPGFARSVLGNERVIVEENNADGSNTQFGAITQNGAITQVQQTPFESSTVKVYVSEATVAHIINSPAPMSELKHAWTTGEIRFEGLNLLSQIKFGVTNFVLNIYFIFVPNPQATYATPSPATTGSATPTITSASPSPTTIVERDDFHFIDCQGGVGLVANAQAITGEDRERFTNITDNITTLTQPNGYTCTPTSGAIDLLHWNDTIAPGIVNMSAAELINDLARRMNTSSKYGTRDDNASIAIGQYLSEHGYGANFTIETYYKGYGRPYNKTAGNTTVQFIPVSSGVSYYELRTEVLKGQNIVFNVNIGKAGHSMKLIALNTTKDEQGTYLVAFADPETGGVVYGNLDRDGNLDIYGRKPMKLGSFIAVSPLQKAQ